MRVRSNEVTHYTTRGGESKQAITIKQAAIVIVEISLRRISLELLMLELLTPQMGVRHCHGPSSRS
jgi:hypothetical protein